MKNLKYNKSGLAFNRTKTVSSGGVEGTFDLKYLQYDNS